MRTNKTAKSSYYKAGRLLALVFACAFVLVLVPSLGPSFAKAGSTAQITEAAEPTEIIEAETLEEYIELTPADNPEAASEDLSAYALKRVLVDAAPEELAAAGQQLFGALSAVSYDGQTLLTFETEKKTKEGYRALIEAFGEDRVLLDMPVVCDEGEPNDEAGPQDGESQGVEPTGDPRPSSFIGWGTEHLGLQHLLARYETEGAEPGTGLSAESGNSDQDKLTIAIIDTGIHAEHEIFEGVTFSEHSRNFAAGSDGTVDPGFLEDNYARYDKAKSETTFGHGTAIAGIIAESLPKDQTELMIIKVFDGGRSCGVVQLLQAVEYAAEHGADLINMSLGGDYKEKNCQLADKVLGGAAAKGIVICSSAGNTMQNLDAPGVNYYPAESPYVTCVSAIGPDNQYAKFSSHGENVDFAAPGLQLKVACPREKATGDQTGGGEVTVDAQEHQYSETSYQESSGTSFACSYITACMVYLKLAHPDHTIWSGRPGLAGHAGFDSQGKDLYYGYGIPAFTEDSVLGPAQAEDVLKASLCEKKLVYSGRQIEPDYKAVYQGAEVPGCDHKLLTNGKTIGTHRIRLTLRGCFAEQPAVTKAYKIVPQAVKVKPVRKVLSKGWTKAGGKGWTAARVSWTKGQKHYQLQIASNKKFKSARFIRTAKRTLQIKNLKQGKTYYVRVRTYKTINGTNYYSAWSTPRRYKAK